MAVNVHIVRVRFVAVSPAGVVIDKNAATTTINDVLRSEHQHRVIPTAAVPSSEDGPTIEDYIIAEAAAGYKVHHMDQTTIITYPA